MWVAADNPAALNHPSMKFILLGLSLLSLTFANVSCASKKDCSSCSSCEKPAASACCDKTSKK